MLACQPAQACYPLFYTLVSGSTHSQTESLQMHKEAYRQISSPAHNTKQMQNKHRYNLITANRQKCTWPPEEDEFKVVLETASVEDWVPKYRKSKSHRKEWFIHHGNLQKNRMEAFVCGRTVSLRSQVAEFFYHKCTHHVVFKAEDAVVDVKLCQLLFMDTDLVLLLDLHYPSLNLLPCCIGELWLKKKSTVLLVG